jgi:hypothetical protein
MEKLSVFRIAEIQRKSHGIPVPFDFPVQRVCAKEIQEAMFFDVHGEQMEVKDKLDLEAYVRETGKCFMVHKLFTKETAYELYLSKSI